MGWSDQCWTLVRITEVVRRRFGVEYTLVGMDLLLHRIGWKRAGPVPQGHRARRGEDRRAEGRAVARHKKTAADLGAWLCFEDEAGQGLRPPNGRTWGRRGRTPVVCVTSAGAKVSTAALICIKPGHRPRLIYCIHLDRSPAKGRRKASPRRTTHACWMPHTGNSAVRSSWPGTI